MKKQIAGLCTFLLLAICGWTQGGEFSVGPRFGGSTGLSIKRHNHKNTGAIEAIAAWTFDEEVEGVSINLLFQKLAPFTKGKRFCAMIGIGPGVVFEDDFRLGLAGIFGLDWRFTNRINMQFDWQPTWYFVNGSYFSPTNAAFTVRWNFFK